MKMVRHFQDLYVLTSENEFPGLVAMETTSSFHWEYPD